MKTMIKLALGVIVMITSLKALAQTNYEDVVYLKNGGVIHGIIIEQIPNKSIKIQTSDRNIFVYPMEEIDKFTKEQIEFSGRSNSAHGKNEIKQSGYTNITEVNLGFGVGNYSEDFSFGIQTINGYLVNPYFSIGFGIGVDKYKYATFLPLFADIRANFMAAPVTPFFAADAGYSLGFEQNKGGLLLNPSFGVKFLVAPKTFMNISFGYRYQENRVDYYFGYYYYNSGSFTVKENEELLTWKLGVTF